MFEVRRKSMTQKNGFICLVLSTLALSVFSGCAKNDYLYYQQPTPPPTRNASFSIAGSKASSADIIWQVGGMTELQQTMIAGAKSFMTQLSARQGFDWKVGVISTDPSDSPFLGFTTSFDSTTPNPIQPFVDSVSNVIASHDGEKMMDPVEGALTAFPGFVRSSSQLVLVVSNDNPDESSEQVANFLAYVTKLKGSLSRVTIYAVLGTTDFGCVPSTIDTDWNYVGSTYEQVIQATHGKAYSLCTDDFGTSLSKIGDAIVDLLARPRYYLATRPITKTIRVVLAGTILPGGPQSQGGLWSYDYDVNAIVFYDAKFMANVDDSEQLQVTYQEDTGQVAPTPIPNNGR
jgi:hypothetical protein